MIDEASTTSSAVGTDAYMAPEQCLPGELGQPGPAADVWGLGATLYKAATGELPFADGSGPGAASPELRWPQLVGRARSAGGVDRRLAETIAACLAPDPAARPIPSAVRAALEPILEALPRPRLSRLKPRL